MTARMPRIVVVGGAYVDMAIRCGHIPSRGQAVAGSELSYTVAGPGPNQAAEVALCGCNVFLIAMVGGDPFGKLIRSSLAEVQVNADFVYTTDVKNTGMVVTLVNNKGENASCICAGSNGVLRPGDIEAAEQVISQADICLIHGRLPQEAIISAIRCAALHNVKVILNPARPIEQKGDADGNLPIDYFSVNVLVANLYEAAEITEQSEANVHTAKMTGSDLVARGVDAAVITIGRRGCVVVDRNGADHVPAFDVELVDQTARGDAFAGALASYLAVKDDIREAAKFASAAGAIACTKFGSIEAMPTRAEIIELLQRHE